MLRARSVAAVLLSFVVALPGFGQTPEVSAGSGGGIFSGLTRNYQPRVSPKVEFVDSPRMERLMRAGQIYLSLRDAIALALENNLDLEYARIGPRLADANVQRASAGQLLRNVSSTVQQGPQSAALGVQAGASSLGTTGASGSGGQTSVLSGLNVQLAGSAIPNLDPVFYTAGSFAHTTAPQSSTFVTGTSFLVTQYKSLVYGVQKGFLTGTTATLGMSNTLGLYQNSPTNSFNPSTTANVSFTFTQHLLQGFGLAVNGRSIRVAKNQRSAADLTFKQQVISSVANIASLYWDLVAFNDALRVKQQALELNQKLYADNKRRSELGAIAPIDIVQAEAEMKAAQQDVTTQETQVIQQEMILKSVLTRGGLDNMAIANARIIPTDTIRIPDQEAILPYQDLVAEALANRPEIEQSRMGLENARISMRGTRNALLPSLDITGGLQNNGQAGQINDVPIPPGMSEAQAAQILAGRNPAIINDFLKGGYGRVLSQIASRNFPNYNIGFQLNVPLRNRAAQADLVTDQLNYRQSQINDRSLQNTIKLNTINASVAVSQARAAYDTSVVARQLQEQTLRGAQRKYELGTSSFLDVVLIQRDTVNRKLAEVNALNQYIRARTSLEQVTGRILKDYDVSIEEAVTGAVKREPDLPVAPAARP